MKQTKESKCTFCEFKKEKNSDYGILYQWFSKFENGDEGFTNTKKKEEPFVVGGMVKYEIENKEFKKDNGDVFKYNTISKPKDQRSFKDDSKERVRGHALVSAQKMVELGLIHITDEENAKGVIIEDRMFAAAKRSRDIMLEALEKKGKDHVFIIMNALDSAIAFAFLRKDMSKFVEDFNKFIEI